VTSISFAKIKFDYENFWKNHSENSDLKENKEYNFEYIDFVVADSHARVHLVQCSLFSEIQSANRKGRLLLEGLHKPVEALVHQTSIKENENPIEDLILSCRDGKIYKWPVKSPFLKVIKHFREEGEYATCLAFSPKEQEYLVAGTNKGNILVKSKHEDIFRSAPLVISQKKKDVCSKKIRFSEDGQNFAIMDNYMCVSLFKLGHKYDDPTREIQWVFSGKIQAHSGRIRDIQFIQKRMWINEKDSTSFIKVKLTRKGRKERIRTAVSDWQRLR
jgi:WD40 repeat protein